MNNHSTSTPTLPDAAQQLIEAGLSVIPISSLATKAPGLESWKPFTVEAAPPELAASWFHNNGHPGAPALAIVCGAVSAGLTVIDFDTIDGGGTLYDDWRALLSELSPGILAKLPVVETPSGGWHVYFRSDVFEGNAKLAESPGKRVWIETRGEGGYVLAPPSPGYRKRFGSLTLIPKVTLAERDLLLNAARSLTCNVSLRERESAPYTILPGDRYNVAATMDSMAELLIKHAWVLVNSNTYGYAFRRPGKDKGVSATLREVSGVPIFYCFSSNAPQVPTGKGLSPFGLYTHLEHGADYSAAAKALAPVKAAPPTQSSNEPEKFDWRRALRPIKELLARDIPDVEFIVPGILPPGVTLLAGAPKTGKSMLAWGIAAAVANGGYALGSIEVKPRTVAYFAMEDGDRLLQKRLRRLLDQQTVPDRLLYSNGWPRLDCGGIEAIAEVLDAHPDALIVIDTYESLRGRGTSGQDAYRNDYSALEPLSRLAHERNASVLIVHHTNKQNQTDFVAQVSGSFGMSGAVDTIAVLRRTRLERTCTLSVTGRELDEEGEWTLEFEPSTLQHTLLGATDEVENGTRKAAILAALRDSDQDMSPKALAFAIGSTSVTSVQHALAELVLAGKVAQTQWGKYHLAADSCGNDSVDSVQSVLPGTDLIAKANEHQAATGGVQSIQSVQNPSDKKQDEVKATWESLAEHVRVKAGMDGLLAKLGTMEPGTRESKRIVADLEGFKGAWAALHTRPCGVLGCTWSRIRTLESRA